MTARKTLAAMTAALIVAMALAALAAQAPRMQLLMERDHIESALHDYFAAEMARDFERVYACLAPSSTYRRSHTYAEFLLDMRDSAVRIDHYEIVAIYHLRQNTDRTGYPHVDRLVQAEVDVTLRYIDTQATRLVNYCFTLLKERGAWYKG